jgi:hypothetical protein
VEWFVAWIESWTRLAADVACALDCFRGLELVLGGTRIEALP